MADTAHRRQVVFDTRPDKTIPNETSAQVTARTKP